MSNSLKNLILGIAVSTASLGLLFTTATAWATLPPDHNARLELEELQKGGHGIVMRNWDCGCGPKRLTRVEAEAFGLYPTRCLQENEPSKILKKGGRPINNLGVEYPTVKYPKGYPDPSPTYPRYPTFPDIPFPCWPKGYPKQTARWNSTDRDTYRKEYEKTLKSRKKLPAFMTKDEKPYPKTPSTGWEYWQIHHMWERMHGGPSTHANLVPALTLPNRYRKSATDPVLNEHNQFTQWWNNVTLDDDVLATIPKIRPKDKEAQRRFDFYTALRDECAKDQGR